jgi:hypothetical protein
MTEISALTSLIHVTILRRADWRQITILKCVCRMPWPLVPQGRPSGDLTNKARAHPSSLYLAPIRHYGDKLTNAIPLVLDTVVGSQGGIVMASNADERELRDMLEQIGVKIVREMLKDRDVGTKPGAPPPFCRK